MKKLLLAAVLTAASFALVSCEADALSDSTPQLEQVHADALGENPPVVGDPAPGEGPGDDVIIIIPPKKP